LQNGKRVLKSDTCYTKEQKEALNGIIEEWNFLKEDNIKLLKKLGKNDTIIYNQLVAIKGYKDIQKGLLADKNALNISLQESKKQLSRQEKQIKFWKVTTGTFSVAFITSLTIILLSK
jgi:hypothetical protein